MLGLSGSLPLSTQLLSQYHIIKIVFLVCFAYFSSTILLRSDFCISKHNVRINTLQKLKIKCFSVSYSEFTNDRWLCSAFKLCIWINDLSGNRHIHFNSHPTGQKQLHDTNPATVRTRNMREYGYLGVTVSAVAVFTYFKMLETFYIEGYVPAFC